jgi:hypothetical protein
MKNLKARKKQAGRGKTQDSDGAVAANFDYSRLSPSFLKLSKPAQRALIT